VRHTQPRPALPNQASTPRSRAIKARIPSLMTSLSLAYSPEETFTLTRSAISFGSVDDPPWLFCTRNGHCYVHREKGTAKGWDSMWQDFMARVLRETKVTERFTEHDLRAKCASDAGSLEHARWVRRWGLIPILSSRSRPQTFRTAPAQPTVSDTRPLGVHCRLRPDPRRHHRKRGAAPSGTPLSTPGRSPQRGTPPPPKTLIRALGALSNQSPM